MKACNALMVQRQLKEALLSLLSQLSDNCQLLPGSICTP